jgi:hypothetical protein
VAFAHRDLFPDREGAAGDRLYADVFEHWLEEVA